MVKTGKLCAMENLTFTFNPRKAILMIHYAICQGQRSLSRFKS